MKTAAYILIIIIILLSGINFYIVKKYKDCSSNKGISEQISTTPYIKKILIEADFNKRQVFTSNIFLINETENKIFSSLNNVEKTLFFCFDPKYHCSTCILETILSLKKVVDKYPIILLQYNTDLKEMKIMAQKLNYQFPSYLVHDSMILNEIKFFKKPFIFTIDKNRNAQKLFFIETDLNSLTEMFLSPFFK